MRNTKAKIYALFIVITAVVACVSRFFLFSETLNDSAHSSNILLYSVYLFIFLSAVFSALYASCAKKNAKTFDFEQAPKGIYITSIALSVTFFYDFLHQGYNCYKYLTETDYADYTYLVPVLIGCVSALVCCFYYITVAATAKNTNYDFRNFTLLHFVPLVWALSKLFLIMFKIVDITENIDMACEFVLLCALMCFLFSMISAIDKKEDSATRVFIFSCVFLGCMALVVGVPRIASLVFYGAKLTSVTYSAVTYIMLGAFSLSLLKDLNKRSKLN